MLHYTCRFFKDLSLEELYEIFHLRMEVFVVEQDCPYNDADNKDQVSWHVMGRNADGVLCAYSRLVPKGVSYEEYVSIGRVITSKSVRRTGAGKELMQQSIAEIESIFGHQKIKISAQTYILKFYQGLGFNPVGKEYLEDDIPHIAMIR